jgi:outer membrane protein assembly factor BamB
MSLPGCWWGQIGFDAGHSRHNTVETGITSANVSSLRSDWSVDLRPESSEPMVRGGRVYLTTQDTLGQPMPLEMHARAVDGATGATVWDTTLLSWHVEPVTFGMVPATLVGDEMWTGYLEASQFLRVKSPVRLRLSDGSVLAEESNWPSSPAVEAGSTVLQLFGTGGTVIGDRLVVRDKTSLATLWTSFVSLDEHFPVSPPAVSDGQIYVVDGSNLLAFPAAGCGASDCHPTYENDLDAGALRTVAAVAGDDAVFVTTQSGEVIAVNRTDGQIAWRSGALSGATFDPAIANGTVYTIAGSTLYAFAADGCGATTCGPLWTASEVLSSAGGPVIAGDLVFASGSGMVKGFTADGCGAATCQPIAAVSVDGEVRHLTVAEGRLFVTSRNPGRLTAFSPH